MAQSTHQVKAARPEATVSGETFRLPPSCAEPRQGADGRFDARTCLSNCQRGTGNSDPKGSLRACGQIRRLCTKQSAALADPCELAAGNGNRSAVLDWRARLAAGTGKRA